MRFQLQIFSIAAVIGIVSVASLAGCTGHSSPGDSAKRSENEGGNQPDVPERVSTFAMSAGKQSAAGIQTGTVVEKSLQALAVVPGRVQYDDSLHIEVKAPTAGVLLEVRMRPGTQVKVGDVLAVLSCPEVGTARADVLKWRVEQDLAQQKYDWKESACTGLKLLVNAVQEGRDPQSLSADPNSQKLGNYRDQVISAYSRFRLAQSLAEAVGSASDSGALSGRTVQERLSERDSSRAALTAVMEQLLFQASQDRDTAKLELEDCERRLKISQQVVQTLLGDSEQSVPVIDEDRLSMVKIQAPINGTIESRTFSQRERVSQTDTLFVLADTTQLWISADIRELEWGALSLDPGEILKIRSPALPDQEFSSKVEYVGREVDPRSNAIPLVAAVSNPNGLLRPGQFVWVQLPLGAAHVGLAVPESAIAEHNGSSFVFVPEAENQFRRVDIQTGIQQDKLVEVVSGLQAGARIVTSGAFTLKSEMLLERED